MARSQRGGRVNTDPLQGGGQSTASWEPGKAPGRAGGRVALPEEAGTSTNTEAEDGRPLGHPDTRRPSQQDGAQPHAEVLGSRTRIPARGGRRETLRGPGTQGPRHPRTCSAREQCERGGAAGTAGPTRYPWWDSSGSRWTLCDGHWLTVRGTGGLGGRRGLYS